MRRTRAVTAMMISALLVFGLIATATPAFAAQCFNRRANVVGTSGDDEILIDEGPNDTIIATVNGVTKVLRGNVVIASLGGDDTVEINLSQDADGVKVWACLGGGNDTFNSVDSNKASVFVNGGAGVDTIHGGGGDDLLKGGDGADEIFGESGTDTCRSPNPAPNQGCEL